MAGQCKSSLLSLPTLVDHPTQLICIWIFICYRGSPLPAMSTDKYKRHSRAICYANMTLQPMSRFLERLNLCELCSFDSRVQWLHNPLQMSHSDLILNGSNTRELPFAGVNISYPPAPLQKCSPHGNDINY